MRRTALWCQVCIREAEQRSQYAAEATDDQDLQDADATRLFRGIRQPADATDTFGALLQEHFDLMEEALLEENDDAIASRISDFMARGRAHLDELNEPEQAQRLTTHLHYWQTFLRALNP